MADNINLENNIKDSQFCALLSRFRVLLEEDNQQEYLIFIEKLVSIDPPMAHYFIGQSFEFAGMSETALKHYIKGSQHVENSFYKNECWKHASRTKSDINQQI